MTLKAAEAIKKVPDEGTACMANCTYHVHPHTGDTWQYAFPGDDGMESIAPLPECERQDIGPCQGGRRMGAGDGRSGAREVGSGGHSACEVPQGRLDDAGGHKVDIPCGDEGASGGTVEGTGSPHHPPG